MRKVVDVPTAAVGEKSSDLPFVQDYLVRFGYLASVEGRPAPAVVQAAFTSAAELPGPFEPGVLDDPTSQALAAFQRFNGVAVSGEFDEVTRGAMSESRCGIPDVGSGLAFSTTCSWGKRDLTFAFDVGTDDIAGGGEQQAVRDAFRTWSAATAMSFTEVPLQPGPVDIVIGWRPAADPDHDMRGGVLAHADFPPDCGAVTGRRLPKPVHFDDEEHLWSVGPTLGAFDVESVALHEIGHILGLLHSNVVGAVMFPRIAGNTVNRVLAPDDVDGIGQLYPPFWSNWFSLGGSLAGDPAVGVNHDGRLEVFIRDSNGAMVHNWQTSPGGGWHGWYPMEGGFTGNPAVGRNHDGRLEVFARGANDWLYHNWQTSPNGGWHGWYPMEGPVTSDPSMGVNQDGRLEVFARGTDGGLYHNWQTSPGGGWHGWYPMEGGFTGNPAVGRNHDGRLEVFARGANDWLYHNWQTSPNGGWHGWYPMEGPVSGDPAVSHNHDGRLEVFIRDSNGAMVHNWQTSPGGGWHGWYPMGGGFTGNPAVGRNRDGRLEIFAQNTTGALAHNRQISPGGGWSGWFDLAGNLTSEPAVATNHDGRLEVFARGANNWLFHKWQQQ